MLIYNITTRVEKLIETEWLQWQKDVHIPGYMNIGLFSSYKIFKLLGHDEPDESTFVMQFLIADKSAYEIFNAVHAETMRSAARKKWGANFVSFESLMESVQ